MLPKHRQKNNAAFTLIELLASIMILMMLYAASTSYIRLTRRAIFTSTVRQLVATCYMLCHATRITGTPHTLTLHTVEHWYHSSLTKKRFLPGSVRFGSSPPTLSGHNNTHTATWQKNGVSNPGTIYVCDVDGGKAALTLARAQHAPVRLYWWRQGKWCLDCPL